jgi:hypothetical protein
MPEPTYAERARTLVHLGRTGALSTLSRRHPGHPFGSLMPYALDAQGRPVFLISAMAMHTQNLLADPRASLLVTQPGVIGDPLAAPRVTLLGEARPVEEAGREAARVAYLACHPNAAAWVDFGDFAFYRLEISSVYFVGGFAAMDWVESREYLAARPDPLTGVASGILQHMNDDHRDALLTFARVLGRVPADEASMVSVDRLGFKLRVRAGDRLASVRIPFPREVTTAEESRTVLIEMLRDARQAASGGPSTSLA